MRSRHPWFALCFVVTLLASCSLVDHETRIEIDKYSGDIQTNINAGVDYFKTLCMEDLELKADEQFGTIRDDYIDGLILTEEHGLLTLPRILSAGQTLLTARERVRSELLARAAQHTKYLRGLMDAATAVGVYNEMQKEIDQLERSFLSDIYHNELPKILSAAVASGMVDDEMESVIREAARVLLDIEFSSEELVDES